MTSCSDVVDAYRVLRDGLTALADRTGDRPRALVLRQRALVAGDLAEQCDAKFSGGNVPHGDGAVDAANKATALAANADPGSANDLDAAAQAAGRANTTLNGIVQDGPRLALFADRFRGSLRVSPPAPAPTINRGIAAPAPKDKQTTAPAQPAYVASVALLFPTEAATLFPLGQAIAGNNAGVLVLIVVIVAAFVVIVRYFATQQEGGSGPAWKEIGIAVVSFLLWVGALKGYWVDEGGIKVGISPTLGAQLFGFVTVMWVAIVPYFVRKPTPPVTPPA